jgi:hypothetical protein
MAILPPVPIKEMTMAMFQTVSVNVDHADSYNGQVKFPQDVTDAQVTLRGLNLPGYSNGDKWHYRGPTIIQITDVSFGGPLVTFNFSYNFSESSSYQMSGSIDFLVIANPK